MSVMHIVAMKHMFKEREKERKRGREGAWRKGTRRKGPGRKGTGRKGPGRTGAAEVELIKYEDLLCCLRVHNTYRLFKYY